MAASREGEVIPGHQHAIGRGAIEQRLACRNRRAAVDIEGRLPIRVPGEDRRVLRRIAEHHERLVAGMNGKHSVARRVARRRNGGDAGRDLRARLEAGNVPGDIRKYPSLVAEGKLQIRRRSVQIGIVHPEFPFRRRHHDLSIGKDEVIVLILDAVDVVCRPFGRARKNEWRI